MDKHEVPKGLNEQIMNTEQIVQFIKDIIQSSVKETEKGMDLSYLGGRARELLSDKYDEEMEVERVCSVNMWQKYYDVLAYSIEKPDLVFKASVAMDDEGQGFVDSYVMRNVCYRMNLQITDLLGGLHGDYFVYSHANFMLHTLDNPDISLDVLREKYPRIRFMIHIFIDAEGYDRENAMDTMQMIEKQFPVVDGVVYFYKTNSDRLKKVVQHTLIIDEPHSDFKEMTEEYMIGTCLIKAGILEWESIRF